MARRRSSRRKIWTHRILASVWAALAVPGTLWWPNSVLFVIIASVYANVASELAAAEAADDRDLADRLDHIEQMLRGGRRMRAAAPAPIRRPRRMRRR